MEKQTVHPRGKKAKILLTSVFGPYAEDNAYGSRKLNPMELYQNQVTRNQGVFSLRMFHRSFSLLMIQANINAPCTVLDFPVLDRFIEEIENNTYDIIGIGSIYPNMLKVKKMCEIIRKHQPGAKIVVGGHIAAVEHLDEYIDADFIVRGDGIRWFREYIGQDAEAPVKHPKVLSAFGTRIMGHTIGEKPGDTAAILIPSVGCPVGCNFCSTSALFGGKGRFISFFETGDELFQTMVDIETELKVRSFFILDENFLLHRKRALRLLELMEKHGKSWALSVFSSARVIKSYTMEQLIGLGISWVWMGVEGEASQYRKLKDVDTKELVSELRSHGIRVLGSSIIGLEHHTPEIIEQIIDRAVSHKSDFHQFMLYMPIPGTPLYYETKKQGRLHPQSRFSPADSHGQKAFNYRHEHIAEGDEEIYLKTAFDKDFEINGPSLARLIRTTLNAWQRYGNHPDPRVRKRVHFDTKDLETTYAGAAWAMKKWFRNNEPIHSELKALLSDIYREFGWKTRMVAPLIGRFLFASAKREEKRLASGWTYEPKTWYEKNEAARMLDEQAAASQKEKENVSWVPADSAVSR